LKALVCSNLVHHAEAQQEYAVGIEKDADYFAACFLM